MADLRTMTDAELVRGVSERWRLRNSSVVIVTHRSGADAAGNFEGTACAHFWTNGKSRSGRGYDLAEMIETAAVERCG